MTHSIKLVVFDWAGTTIDFGGTAPVSAFKVAFENFGVAVSDEEIRAPMGKLKIDHIRSMLSMPEVAARWSAVHGALPTEADAQRLYKVFEPAQMSVLDRHCDLKPWLIECVCALRGRGIRIGSTTGFTRSMMTVVAPMASKAGYAPDEIITAEDVGDKGRPWPFMIFENMYRLSIPDVSSVVKVGDTVSDIEEALAAGVTAVGVVEGASVIGFSKHEWFALTDQERAEHRARAANVFRRAGAHYVINSLFELPDLIDEIERR